MKIVVLAGGLSPERNVSLSTGTMVAEALQSLGHQTALVDMYFGVESAGPELAGLFGAPVDRAGRKVSRQAPDLQEVRSSRKGTSPSLFGPGVLELCAMADLVFLALHGSCGEDGRVQAAFDLMGIPYTGAGYLGSAIAEPDVCLITNIGDSHIEHLGSRENILKAKCEIFSHAKPYCTAVLNGDDELLRTLADTLDGSRAGHILWVGGRPGLDYTADHLVSDGKSNLHCEVITPHMTCEVDIPALGSHMIYPTLMAAAAAERFGVSAEEFRRGVLHFAPTKMRMNILQREEDITILNDTYNANPQSMRAAVEVLSKSHGERKVAVLGDMFELGALAPALHAGIGSYLGKAGVDTLVAVGELAKNIYDAARDAMVPEVHYCATKEEALPVLAQVVKPHTTILVKASRGMAFEELVEYLKGLTKEA